LKKIIIDLDGCLCHTNSATIEKMAKWAEENGIPWPIISCGISIANPKFDKEMIELLQYLRFSKFQILIFTVRPKETKSKTEKQLARNNVIFDSLKFIKHGKGRKDRKIQYIREEKKALLLVVEDDREVVEMCREEGCNALYPWEFKEKINEEIRQRGMKDTIEDL